MKVTVQHRFHGVDVERFVDAYYSADFNRAVAASASLKVRELTSTRTLDDGTIERRVRMVPDVELPAPVRALVAGDIEFYEVSVYDPRTKSARYHVESAAGDAVVVRGDVRFEKTGDDVLRTIDGEVVVKVFGLGGIIERLIASEVKGRYDRIQAFTQRWLDDHR